VVDRPREVFTGRVSLRGEFEDVGYVRVREAFDGEAAAAMLTGIWNELERRRGARRDDPSTWPRGAVNDLKSSKTSRLGLRMFGPRLREALDELFGPGRWDPPRKPGFVLCTFPDDGASWRVPDWHWHCDFPLVGAAMPALDPLSAVTLFAFHDDVVPHGGGTLLLRRSHRIARRFVESLPDELPPGFDVRHTFMRHHPWLDELRNPSERPDRTRRFLEQGADIDGVETVVEELVGRAGDVVITHPWIFHCVAPNRSDRPRIMRRSSVSRRT
jgi:ectoine hydroxylase-related dioxygenase (phytanoyl-CoA dioxygenase family)